MIQRDLLAFSDKEVMIYDSNDNQFVEYDKKLKKVMKNSVCIGVSENGEYICFQQNDGNFVIYETKSQQLLNLQGLQNQFKKSPTSNFTIYVNDDLTTIILREQQQDYFWLWSRVKEALILTQQNEKDKIETVQPNRKKGLYRSNSSDRRANTPEGQDPEGLIQDKPGEIQLRGTWNKIFMNEFSIANRPSSYQESFDLKFAHYGKGSNSIKALQTQIYTKTEYFGNLLKKTPKQQMQDEIMILQIATQNLRLNFANKGGTFYDTTSTQNKLRSKVSALEFMGNPSQPGSVITKLDNSGQIAVTVLNSIYKHFCQVVFSNIDTQISTVLKLFNFITTEDSPPFDQRGQTNLFIDDVAWTNNDVFVILLFNANSFGLLPRLGNSLVAIFNPTIINISQSMVDQFQQYKEPKCFNELILPYQIKQKLGSIKQVVTKKKLFVHPYEDSLLIYDGVVCFVIRMEFEQQLSDLFTKQNIGFYFLRFCVSLEKVLSNPEILEKIPQLLTSKLPLFEFEKNVEADEEEEPGQVILTASQINPFEMGPKRMDTNQSFNAEFTLESSEVLLNLKHLLMSLRWNKDQPVNYYQWLVTVINDCFFYFLKNSEPVYAFHALRMAEAYCKKALYTTESDTDQSSFQTRNNEYHSSRMDVHDFNNLKQYFEAVFDMYDYHNTEEYMQKSTLEKMQVNYDLITKLPVKIFRGSGNWRFQFSKNYALLVYYSLIQFRNYQAANFNILFLVFACYIMQRYLDQMFFYHLQRIIEIVFRNFQSKKKSDDYELFLGKSGKNFLFGPPEKMKVYQDWVTQPQKFLLSHVASLYDHENTENLMDTILNNIQHNKEKVEKNLGFIGELNHLFLNLKHINQMNLVPIRDTIVQLTKEKPEQEQSQKVINIGIGFSLHLMLEMIRKNILNKEQKQISIYGLFSSFQKLLISVNSKYSVNIMDSHKTLFESNFSQNKIKASHDELQKKVLELMGCKSEKSLRHFMSVLYFYLNDIDSGNDILTNTEEDYIMKIFLLSTCAKGSLRSLEILNTELKGVDNQNFKNEVDMQKYNQKANIIMSIKKSLMLLKTQFYEMISSNQSPDKPLTKRIWIALNTITPNSRLILKEELTYSSIKKLSKIFKYLKLQFPNHQKNMFFYKKQEVSKISQKYSIAVNFLKIASGENWYLIEEIFRNNEELLELFYQQLEIAIVGFVFQETCQSQIAIKDGETYLQDDPKMISLEAKERTKSIQMSQTKQFLKFSKIISYINLQVEQTDLQMQIQNEISKSVLEGRIANLNSFKTNLVRVLINLSFYEKYQPSQICVSQALNTINTMLDVQFQEMLGQSIAMIRYSVLNRSNKQRINTILDKAKQNSELGAVIQSLENVIYATQDTDFLQISTIKYQKQLIYIFNEKLNLKSQVKNWDSHTTLVKQKLLFLYQKAKNIFNLSFNESLFFDKVQFCKRPQSIFGITNEILEKFQETLKKHEQKRQDKMKTGAQTNNKYDKHDFNRQDSTRIALNKILESPGRPVPSSKDKDKGQNIEITKDLMKGRQLGGEMTPKGPRPINLEGNMKMLNFQNKMIPRNIIHKLEQSPMASKRNESIEFDNREMNVAHILKNSKRKNSYRRFALLSNSSGSGQEESKNQQFGLNIVDQKGQGGHRKNQHSVHPKAGQPFLLTNQDKHDIPKSKQPQIPRAPKPNTKPKAIVKQSNQTKEQLIGKLIKVIEKSQMKKALEQWRENLQIEEPVVIKEEPEEQEVITMRVEKEVPQFTSGSFNIMFVKSTDTRSRVKTLGGSHLQVQTAENEKKETLLSENSEKFIQTMKPLRNAKPFQLVKIQTKQGNEENKETTLEKNSLKITQHKKVSHKGSKSKFQSKQQQMNFMVSYQRLIYQKKLNQISEKINKVQKEADQLGQDYSKLN